MNSRHSFECTGCTACCGGWSIPADDPFLTGFDFRAQAELRRAAPLLGTQPLLEVVPTRDGAPIHFVAARGPWCVMLEPGGTCCVHRFLGFSAKPRTCREYPYLEFEGAEGQRMVSIRLGCFGYAGSLPPGERSGVATTAGQSNGVLLDPRAHLPSPTFPAGPLTWLRDLLREELAVDPFVGQGGSGPRSHPWSQGRGPDPLSRGAVCLAEMAEMAAALLAGGTVDPGQGAALCEHTGIAGLLGDVEARFRLQAHLEFPELPDLPTGLASLALVFDLALATAASHPPEERLTWLQLALPRFFRSRYPAGLGR